MSCRSRKSLSPQLQLAELFGVMWRWMAHEKIAHGYLSVARSIPLHCLEREVSTIETSVLSFLTTATSQCNNAVIQSKLLKTYEKPFNSKNPFRWTDRDCSFTSSALPLQENRSKYCSHLTHAFRLWVDRGIFLLLVVFVLGFYVGNTSNSYFSWWNLWGNL